MNQVRDVLGERDVRCSQRISTARVSGPDVVSQIWTYLENVVVLGSLMISSDLKNRGSAYGCCGHFLERREDILHVLLGEIGELLSMVYGSASFARPRLPW
jgi:hypothetical protein